VHLNDAASTEATLAGDQSGDFDTNDGANARHRSPVRTLRNSVASPLSCRRNVPTSGEINGGVRASGGRAIRKMIDIGLRSPSSA
jgi:hypothetical protein